MFTVGQKVRVKKFDVRPSHWNTDGKMDKWMGKDVTIKRTPNEISSSYKIEEDVGEWGNGSGWFWKESDFETISSSETTLASKIGSLFNKKKGGEDMKSVGVYHVVVVDTDKGDIRASDDVVAADEKSACARVSLSIADKIKGAVFHNLEFICLRLGSFEQKS